MVQNNMKVKWVVKEDFFIFGVLKIIFELKKQIFAFTEIINENSGTVSERHTRTGKNLGTNYFTFIHIGFQFYI